MAASVVQSASAITTTNAATVSLGATPTVGNTLVAFMSSDTTSSAVPNAGTSKPYTQQTSKVDSQGFYVWTRLVASGDSASTTFTLTSADNGVFVVAEVAGTLDKVSTPTSTVNTPDTSRTTTGNTPASADNVTLAVVGMHNISAVITSPAVDNGFTVLRTQANTASGTTVVAMIVASKVTASTAATGTTTLSWATGQANNRNGTQITFSGLTAVDVGPPELVMAPIRR